MSQNNPLEHLQAADREDILELERRIANFQRGKEDEERFKLYRLTRGVYGQRQTGVQMFRIKIPFGKLTAEQLERIADISETYTNGNLHITTRQNIQLHYVKLKDSPAIWAALAEKQITAREACGNTVRNLTASPLAGVDPEEVFDPAPYSQAAFEYFLRNPICQDMGRKIKIAFSSSERDSAFTYFHDFGFIPRLNTIEGQEQWGFKVVIGGGLGAVSMVAQTAYEFLPEDQLIPFLEAALRVFDRYGEREKRMKARMKFLVKKLGLDGFMDLVRDEWKAIKYKTFTIDRNTVIVEAAKLDKSLWDKSPVEEKLFEQWKATNIFEQKQKGYYAVQVRVPLGNISAETARSVARLVRETAADDIRMTINQGFLLRFVLPEALPHVFNQLHKLGLAAPGFDSTADITACPGTDTCALGVTNSTGLAQVLEGVIREEYPDLIEEQNLKIKISGCMNACGQHMAAQIGFHGSSIKKGALVAPAMQVVLGGGVSPEGEGFIADKVIKLPTKRIPEALRSLLDDYIQHAKEGEYFNNYYYRRKEENRYFYHLLKPLSDFETLTETDFFDWGQDRKYVQEIGVGECAGVTLDLVGTIIADAREKIELADRHYEKEEWAEGLYYSYLAFVIGAKGLLLGADVKCNTHRGILKDFQTNFVEKGSFFDWSDFPALVTSINQYEPEEAFARDYGESARAFIKKVIQTRENGLAEAGADKLVVNNYYKA